MENTLENASFLHLGNQILYLGVLGHVQAHTHAAPVYLAGIYDSFKLRIQNGGWLECRTAIVPAGVSHQLDAGDTPLAAMYLPPQQAHRFNQSQLITEQLNVPNVLSGKAGETRFFRELYEDKDSHVWSEDALTNLLNSQAITPKHIKKSAQPIDLRIANVLALMHQNPNNTLSIDQLAASQGLSASSFMHLFLKETGTSCVQYRLWCKLQLTMKKVAMGNNLTNAALDAGFYDSQHFSHVFLKSFGIQASKILRRVSRANIIIDTNKQH